MPLPALPRWGRWLLAFGLTGPGLLLGCSREQAAPAPVVPVDVGRVERLYLDDVFPGPHGERAVELHFRAVAASGFTVQGLASSHLTIFEDDRRVDASDVK